MGKEREKTNKAVKTKRVRKKTNWILYIAVVAFVIYIAVTIVDQNVKIRKGKEEISRLDNEITLQTIKNDELKSVADAAEELITVTASQQSSGAEESSDDAAESSEDPEQNDGQGGEDGEQTSEGENSEPSEVKKKTDYGSVPSNLENYIEKEARMMGYVKTGERVFENIAGN